jgi:hypothetical protein
MYSGIKILHRNTKLFLSDNEKDFYEKLLQSKDELLKSNEVFYDKLLQSKEVFYDKLLQSKEVFYDKLLQSKDGELKSKDGELKSKDGELKSKDEVLKSKDEVLKSKDGELKSKDEVLKSKDGELKLKDEILSITNTEILDLQGRLSFRSVFEQFEQRCGTKFVSDSSLVKGITQREKIWNWIIENNCSGINQYLGENSTDWPSVAKSLYKLISDDIHKYKSKKVVINNTSMSAKMTVLAEAICKVFPIKYDIITPSPLDLQN